jgi:2-dehydro-3-deoxyphosphooctonate aldolase (KDO 8-P synthase)
MFLETHQDPDNAPCEGQTMLPLKAMPELLQTLVAFDRLAKRPRTPRRDPQTTGVS